MKNNISFNSKLSKFGIGLFETIKIENEPIDFDLHMNRLYNSIRDLNIKIDIDKSTLKDKVLMYIKHNNIKNKALRVTLFDEGYNISTRDIIYNDKMYNEGFKLTISPIKRGDSIIYRHKTTNYFENIYTKEYATKNGFDDAIFLSTEGKILECSMCNIFFIKDNKLFETVSFKLSTAPTIFWGTRLYDSNTMQLICNSEAYSKCSMQKWLVVYPDEENKAVIEDYEDMGFNIIEADTKELISYLGKQSFARNEEQDKYIYKEYREKFPTSFICNELKKSGVKRPVVDFFAGAEPVISDIVSNNVTKTSYYSVLLETILKGNITLITGIPGCGKSTLLMQLAFSDELSGRKFWFNNIIKQEAEKLVDLVKEDKNVTIFIDNLYSNVDALNVLKEAGNIKLVLAERALNYEYVKRFLNISSDRIVDISELNKNDIQMICKSMNRSSSDAFDLMEKNQNISLLEIVFYTATYTQIQ